MAGRDARPTDIFIIAVEPWAHELLFGNEIGLGNLIRCGTAALGGFIAGGGAGATFPYKAKVFNIFK